jgi:hypothetical protein
MAILHNRNLQSSGFDPITGLFFSGMIISADFAATGRVSAGRSTMRTPPAPSSWPVFANHDDGGAIVAPSGALVPQRILGMSCPAGDVLELHSGQAIPYDWLPPGVSP